MFFLEPCELAGDEALLDDADRYDLPNQQEQQNDARHDALLTRVGLTHRDQSVEQKSQVKADQSPV